MLSFDTGNTLKDLRKGAGYTQEDIAELLYTQESTICKIEKGTIRMMEPVAFLNWMCKCANGPITLAVEGNEIKILQPAQEG